MTPNLSSPLKLTCAKQLLWKGGRRREQQGRERVRALDGGWAAGGETGRATPSRNWIARAWAHVYILEGTSGLSGQNIP